MVPRIPPLPYRKVSRFLQEHGFYPIHQTGSHVVFRHADGRKAVVPHHAREDISPGLLRAILRQAGIDPDEHR